ncbi:MAG: hypothetical protein U5L09_19265 [Bacteroidales bacterium]|nr:hypothetical protein [Bacteroidales bacterium]
MHKFVNDFIGEENSYMKVALFIAHIGSVEVSEEGETATESDEGNEPDKAENSRDDAANGGGITFGEADGHYKWGNGQPLYVDLDRLDFGDVKMSRFDNPEFFIEGHPGVYVRFETSDYVNRNQALVYGTIGIVKIGDNRIMAMPDTYNFDFKLQKGTFIRDAATILGKHYAGYGTPFPIYFRGTTTLP